MTVDTETVMRVARAYSKLGWAVQEQVERVLQEGAGTLDLLFEEGLLNPNALASARMFFKALDKACPDEPWWDEIEEWLQERSSLAAN